jgi:PilZ domain
VIEAVKMFCGRRFYLSANPTKFLMQLSQRQHIRFSLDLPAIRYTRFGERQEILLHQISIGGCLLEWDENILTGEVFRLEIQLPNKNWLPLNCKVLYKFEDNGIGAKFLEITKFEQELVGKIISHSLIQVGLPTQIDPFSPPPKFADAPRQNEPSITDSRQQKEEMLEKIMSSEM